MITSSFSDVIIKMKKHFNFIYGTFFMTNISLFLSDNRAYIRYRIFRCVRHTFSIKIILCQFHPVFHLLLEAYLLKFDTDSYRA